MEPSPIFEWLWIASAVIVAMLGIWVIYIDHTYISREMFDKTMEKNFETVKRNEDLIVGHINKINEQLGNKDIITR